MRRVVLMAAIALLAGCAGSPTHSRWSCALPVGAHRTCASITEIDKTSGVADAEERLTLRALTGAAPARLGRAGVPEGTPTREGDSVLRIVVAPWIDAAGDYHARSDIFAVVRRGGWALADPPAPPPAPSQGLQP